MLKNYLIIALRGLLKNKVFIFTNVLGLGIAISCCMVAYLSWEFNHNFDKNHVNGESIYRVQAWQEYQGTRSRYAVVPTALGGILKHNMAETRAVVRYTTSAVSIRIADEVFNTSMAYADSGFFDLFSFEPVDGSFRAFHDKSTIVISDALARKYFNTENVAGRQVTQIYGSALKEFVIAGVFKEQPLNSSFGFEAITLWDNYKDVATNSALVDENWKNMTTLFMQIEADDVPAVAAQLQHYIEPQNLAREDLKFSNYYLQPFSTLAASFHGDTWLNGEQLRWGFPPSVIVGPGVMALFLLLLACFNFTNTSIAISGRRLKEIGIRKTMGGLRSQLVAQFMAESFLICFLALLTGVVLAEILAPAYASLWPSLKLVISYTENIFFFAFLTLLLITTALIAGTYPAFYISSFKPVAILKGKMKFAGTNWFTRSLLTFQFAISLVCIILGVAFFRNASYQRVYDLGYAKDGIIRVDIANEKEFETYRTALLSNGDILAVAGSRNHVSDRYYKAPVKYQGKEQQVEIVDIGDGYLPAMNITLLEGRDFRKDSETDKKESVLVSENFVKKYGWTDGAVGKRLLLEDSLQLFVVGVVNDILTDGFWKPAEPVMLRYVGPEGYTQLVVSCASTKLLAVNDFMKAEWKKISPNTMYNGQHNDGNMWASQMINNNAVSIFGFLGMMAAFMSATGLFALMSLNLLKKMKEIGVRKVLGASALNIARVINIEFVIILSLASLVGCTLGHFAARALMDAIWEYFLPANIATLVMAVVFLFLMAIITVGYKTIVTAWMNPVGILKEE
jgi:putative ABC transport system permease protein